ncbi:Ubiquinone biosynthesis protein coq9, mitochondrial [Toensbergia leucococca]|nr:Ubiquinone biosynthesis protein coq9, mitochondrial [Toensbergia leucococca]
MQILRIVRSNLLGSRACFSFPFKPATSRLYHSYEHDQPPPFTATESAILSSALSHVPTFGFTTTALSHGAQDVGYLAASVNLFPRGAFDLVNYHLVSQRLALQKHASSQSQTSIGSRVRSLALARLHANKPIIHHWQSALAIMASPTNISTSLAELARLSDEIWFLTGDVSVDTSWYTKRASLSAIYSSTEIFMTQDTSTKYVETERFLDRRLAEAKVVGSSIRGLGEWAGFTGHSVINILRSKGVRI